MNIKSVALVLFIIPLLNGYFLIAPAQALSLQEIEVHEQETDNTAVVIEPVAAAPRLDPYAVIESARHGERGDRFKALPLQDIQQVRGRLDLAITDAKGRLSEIPSSLRKDVIVSPIEALTGGVRDRFNQIQQTIKFKASNLLERIGNRANQTAEQLRTTD